MSMKESVEVQRDDKWVPFTDDLRIQDFPSVRVREVITRDEAIRRYGKGAIEDIIEPTNDE